VLQKGAYTGAPQVAAVTRERPSRCGVLLKQAVPTKSESTLHVCLTRPPQKKKVHSAPG